jgi:phenylacetic acid degradation operon negative regulatory protein
MAQPRKTSTTAAPTIGAAGDDGGTAGTRALTARSVVASTLLGMTPPRLSSRLLARSGELFGIAEGTTRVALSRMVSAGELEPVDGSYHLAGHLLARHERQNASRSSAPARRRWSGDWELQFVTGGRRDARERAQLRVAMRQLELAEGREGVWLRPANLDSDRMPEARSIVSGQCWSFVGRPDDDDPATLAARLWDLDGWATGAHALREQMAADIDRLEAGDTSALAPTFVVSAAVLRHLVADPQLPAELCPGDWPGDELRSEYERYDVAFKRVWRAWFRRQR